MVLPFPRTSQLPSFTWLLTYIFVVSPNLYLNIAFVLGKAEKMIYRPTAKYSLRATALLKKLIVPQRLKIFSAFAHYKRFFNPVHAFPVIKKIHIILSHPRRTPL
jgi:hypothetical protein